MMMKYKYVEERYPRYYEFGVHPDNINVDIASSKNDIVASVTKEHAKNLIVDRDEVVEMLCAMACEFARVAPEAFEKFWYSNLPAR